MDFEQRLDAALTSDKNVEATDLWTGELTRVTEAEALAALSGHPGYLSFKQKGVGSTPSFRYKKLSVVA